jgi:hypothetical protein
VPSRSRRRRFWRSNPWRRSFPSCTACRPSCCSFLRLAFCSPRQVWVNQQPWIPRNLAHRRVLAQRRSAAGPFILDSGRRHTRHARFVRMHQRDLIRRGEHGGSSRHKAATTASRWQLPLQRGRGDFLVDLAGTAETHSAAQWPPPACGVEFMTLYYGFVERTRSAATRGTSR